MLSRRVFVGKLAAGAAGAVVALGAGVSSAKGIAARAVPNTALGNGGEEPPRPRDEAEAPQGGKGVEVAEKAPLPPPPWEILSPLAAGSVVAHGWKVADLSSVQDGATVLTLENERGRQHRVHVCRNGGRPQGLVHTEHFDLVVMNGGQGDLPTDEGFAQAVAEVSHVLAANERRQPGLVASLKPHAERLELAEAKLR